MEHPTTPIPRATLMTPDEIKALVASVMREIGGHTLTTPPEHTLPRGAGPQIQANKAWLEQLLGHP